MMNTCYSQLRAALSPRYGEAEARAIAFLVMEKGFGVGRTDIYADKVRDFSEDEGLRFRNICERLEKGEPVHYVLGSGEFAGHDFSVSPAVLIPRPETEELVAQAVGTLRQMRAAGTAAPRVLDAGTGSGCIAVSIALACPWAEVEACDLSEAALRVARANAAALQAAVRFFRCDLLAPWPAGERYHLIVSNPPYICQSEQRDMEPHVLDHEPHAALFVPDADPLRFYRALALQAAGGSLCSGGRLAVEINRAYGSETAALFSRSGLRRVQVLPDSLGNDRMVLDDAPE